MKRKPTPAMLRLLRAMADNERPHQWTEARAMGSCTRRTWAAIKASPWVTQTGALLRGEPCYTLSDKGRQAVQEAA